MERGVKRARFADDEEDTGIWQKIKNTARKSLSALGIMEDKPAKRVKRMVNTPHPKIMASKRLELPDVPRRISFPDHLTKRHSNPTPKGPNPFEMLGQPSVLHSPAAEKSKGEPKDGSFTFANPNQRKSVPSPQRDLIDISNNASMPIIDLNQ